LLIQLKKLDSVQMNVLVQGVMVQPKWAVYFWQS